jgi:hypothetical protein
MSKRPVDVWYLIFVPVLLICFLTGCATIPIPTSSERIGMDDPFGRCADFFDYLNQHVVQAGAIDPGSFRVQGYPYLRVDRFLASFREEISNEAAFASWVNRMQALDQNARKHEIANLPNGGTPADKEALYQRVVSCGNLLKASDFQDDRLRRELREKVTAPDDYILIRQILGIYPITRWFVAMGVSRWHDEVFRTFSVEPPTGWQSIRYVPATGDADPETCATVAHTQRDALGIPQYTADALETLFQCHAPVWKVETHRNDDRIGMPFWTSEGNLSVNTSRPITYTLLSYTRFQNVILTQLNYIIWFPSRPKVHIFDIYGGMLDGLNYRVTLDPQGEPLLYDSVHHCGCYYAAYPTPRLKIHEKIPYREPPLILKAPDNPPDRHWITVAMKSRTHFVRHLYPSGFDANSDTVVYTMLPYDQLRSMKDAHGEYRSMFDQDSLVPGSQRLERWLFWPTGVYSAGAMRQWCRHAVAFAGRRHYDDPFFMEKIFEYK